MSQNKARKIMEGTVLPIKQLLEQNLPTALGYIRTDRTDNKVNVEKPQEYLIFEKAIGYRTPTIFILGDEIDFRKSIGQNHINASVKVTVQALVDDRNAELLTLKIWRYHDALHEVLDRAEVTDNGIKNVVKVVGSTFSPTLQNKSNVESPFRREVMLRLEVEHFEQE